MSKKNFKGGFDALLGSDIASIETEKTDKNTSKKLTANSETRATFLVDTKQLEQIKAISYWDRKMLKTVLYEALDKYINEYQKIKGDIKLPNG